MLSLNTRGVIDPWRGLAGSGHSIDENLEKENINMKPLALGDVTVTSIVERDGPWRCLLYTSPSPRDMRRSRMPSSA